MFNGSNCDRKSQLSGILTEPLNPRESLLRGCSDGLIHKINEYKTFLKSNTFNFM